MVTVKKSAPSNKSSISIEVFKVERGITEFCVLGTSPLFFNQVSEKAKRVLVYPSGPMTKADKAVNLKHDPLAEFRASPYLSSDSKGPTFLLGKAEWFKGAIKSAALDMPGSATKAQVGRLTYVMGDVGDEVYISIYGVPVMDMDIVRMADIARTPDIRTRAVIKKWACRVTIRYSKPMLTDQAVANLFAGAGFLAGVGDGRTQKGTRNNGEFELVSADDPRFEKIVATGGRKVQMQAMKDVTFSNVQTEDLFNWYTEEVIKRGKKMKEPAKEPA